VNHPVPDIPVATVPQLELLQPLEGPSIYHEWMEQHGESLHHVAVYVESLDDSIRSIERAGYELIQCGRGMGLDNDGGFAYFDTQSELGLVLEVIERPARRREPELVIP
jgi:methylmalonyl-CoA/ethylmalonyl-CoA epimerase